MSYFKKIHCYLALLITLTTTPVYAAADNISLFPIEHYNQNINDWIQPQRPDYRENLLETKVQQEHLVRFYDHYFGLKSPWSEHFVNQWLQQVPPDDLLSTQTQMIADFNNQGKPESLIGYGENFRPTTVSWINAIADNMNLEQFKQLVYQPRQRGITVDNLHVRMLPTEQVSFYSHQRAGQGYPFDNLQLSSIWVGTPVYILGESHDGAWLLVLSPDFIGWVKSNGIARTDSAFIHQWTTAAKKQLAAITQTKTSLHDEEGYFRFEAYIGSVFPVVSQQEHAIKMMIPVMERDKRAAILYATVDQAHSQLMPLRSSPENIATIMRRLLGRDYGWGNLYFYNDCSAELKNFFTPFGIWLPRQSSDQMAAGKMVDMSDATPEQRLTFLAKNGHPFFTLVYLGEHVVMYLGNYAQSGSVQPMVMTYQNIWALSPNPAIHRSVIGQSVLLPMLLQYPEDANLMSLANKKYFQVIYLDEIQ